MQWLFVSRKNECLKNICTFIREIQYYDYDRKKIRFDTIFDRKQQVKMANGKEEEGSVFPFKLAGNEALDGVEDGGNQRRGWRAKGRESGRLVEWREYIKEENYERKEKEVAVMPDFDGVKGGEDKKRKVNLKVSVITWSSSRCFTCASIFKLTVWRVVYESFHC